ncbi:MAG: Hsp20/alpha crystallin family protein [Desulfobacteraceae bacterium]|nr:Hsp20/alpha crystallin family protein [Desulfobacteraceae bacterium]MDH3835544.1 Hsp20/alpha crystallin family protein [Desulfobacteraceae bacterium]MDH3873425.1 Hsp20/alpha crystallin family protein [Desulfobacteraceae bacterium]
MIYRRMFGLPDWQLRDRFHELEQMRRQMDRLFGALTDGSTKKTGSGVFPAINLTESMDNYYLRAELSGVKAEDLDIQTTGKNISISGERKIFDVESNAKYHRRERDAGKFSRIVGLPDYVDSDAVEASLINGILTVVIPKKENAKPRQISIK